MACHCTSTIHNFNEVLHKNMVENLHKTKNYNRGLKLMVYDTFFYTYKIDMIDRMQCKHNNNMNVTQRN